MAYTFDPQRQLGDANQYSMTVSANHDNATCTVTLGNLDTCELPWVAQRVGGMRCWSPPALGEQWVVLALKGDLENGFVVLGLLFDDNPRPSNDSNVVQIDMPDSATIASNYALHAVTVTLPADGTATIDAPDGGTILRHHQWPPDRR